MDREEAMRTLRSAGAGEETAIAALDEAVYAPGAEISAGPVCTVTWEKTAGFIVSPASAPAGSHAAGPSGGTPAAQHEREASSTGAPQAMVTPAGLLAGIPRLLGFRPGQSLVIVGTGTPDSRGRVKSLTVRCPLPREPDPVNGGLAETAARMMRLLGAEEIATASAVGYGPDSLITPLADELRTAASRAGVTLTHLLRAEDSRYWHCSPAGGGQAEGTPYGEGNRTVPALPAGVSRVLASREELTASIAPATGEPAAVMDEAIRDAEEHAAVMAARAARPGEPRAQKEAIAAAGTAAVREAIARYRDGGRLDAGDGAARLLVLLRDRQVRDSAWTRMDPEHREEHLRLWADLTRLARPGYAAAPASLLAVVAWQCGNGALAHAALDLALDDDPQYTMAQLVRSGLDSDPGRRTAARPAIAPERWPAGGHGAGTSAEI